MVVIYPLCRSRRGRRRSVERRRPVVPALRRCEERRRRQDGEQCQDSVHLSISMNNTDTEESSSGFSKPNQELKCVGCSDGFGVIVAWLI